MPSKPNGVPKGPRPTTVPAATGGQLDSASAPHQAGEEASKPMATVPATPEEGESEQVPLSTQAGHWIAAVVVAVLGFFAPALFVTSWVPMIRAVIAVAVLAGLISVILLVIGAVIV